MGGLGPTEVLVILAIVALLFGPTLVAFLAGYALGQRRGSATASAPEPPAPETPETPEVPAAPVLESPEATPANDEAGDRSTHA